MVGGVCDDEVKVASGVNGSLKWATALQFGAYDEVATDLSLALLDIYQGEACAYIG